MRILAICVLIFISFQIVLRIFRKLIHFPAPAFIGRFLASRIRKWMQPPEKLIERSGIRESMVVLDAGCGSGAFTTYAARSVGRAGKVFALDVQLGMLEQLRMKLTEPVNSDVNNIELINSSACDLPFENDFFDVVFMVTVLQEIPDRERALREVKRVLKSGGIIAVSEFLPDPDYPLKSTTIRMLEKAGFALDGASGNIWNYTVRAKKS